jgi:hypothetical protein
MANLTPEKGQAGWRRQAYIVGAAVGSLLGLASAYMYTRAAEEDAERIGKPKRVQTGDLLGLGLALLAILRQVAELGKTPEKKK